MPEYKIDLVQVRKMTVYCSAEDEEGAREWFEENKDKIYGQLDMDMSYIFNPANVYCFTTYSFEEDNSSEILFDLLHEEESGNEEQMEGVYKALKEKQNQKKDSE